MHDCENCSKRATANHPETIPYIVHESEMAKAERRSKQMLFAAVVSISSMLLSNLAWLIAWVA